LRTCLRLASELKNQRLKTWANQELDGYKGIKTDEELPVYRRQVHAGAFGRFAERHTIIPAAMEQEHRRYAESVNLVQSVSALYNLMGTDMKNGVLAAHWPPNMVAYYSTKLWPGWACHDAWQEVPMVTLVAVLDSVRNITLRMALEIEDERGTSYADLNRINPEEVERVKSVVINNLSGNVALGDMHASGQTVIIAGDRKSPDVALTKAGMNQTDLSELTEAIQTDGNKAGSKVTKWIGDKAEKMLIGGVKIGASIAQ
jgi:hypothetical protein